MTKFCVCLADGGNFNVCIETPLGSVLVMVLDRERFENLREKLNSCHDKVLAGEVPECVRKAFEKSERQSGT